MSFIQIRGRDAKPLLMFVLGFFMIPVCFALSIGPATWFSERGPDAKELPYHFGDAPLWVAPWLFYFSMLFHYLMWAGMCLFVVGISWLGHSRAMQEDTQVLRSKAGVRALCVVIYLAGLVLLTMYLPFGIPDRHRVWVVPAFAIFGLFFLADVFITRIVLRRHSIHIVSISDFQSRTIPREEIEGVTWEKGGGTSLLLRGGEGVHLPGVTGNAQGLTNTIRAWLRRT